MTTDFSSKQPVSTLPDRAYADPVKSGDNGSQADAQQKVAQAFSKAAAIYLQHAQVQKQVAADMLQWFDKSEWAERGKSLGNDKARLSVVDLGCGPANCYPILKSYCPALDYIGVDIAEGMLQQAQKQYPEVTTWVVADMQQVPLADRCADMIISSSSMQWLNDLTKVLLESKRLLRSGGSILLAFYIDGTLSTLSQGWRNLDQEQHVNAFLTMQQVQQQIEEAGFMIDKVDQKQYLQPFANVLSLLRSLKCVGAHTLKQSQRNHTSLTKGQLKQLEQSMRDSQQGAVIAEYQTVFIKARLNEV